MPNNIQTFRKTLTSVLDIAYAKNSISSVLDSAPELVEEGANAGDLSIPTYQLDGLANYSRQTGYVKGFVTAGRQNITADYDRGRKFEVDAADDLETAGIAFGQVAQQFLKIKVAPELDAYRFAKYLTYITPTSEDVTTSAQAVSALGVGFDSLCNSDVDLESVHLFATSKILRLAKENAQNVSVLDEFGDRIHTVPQTRFMSAINLLSGGTGEEAGGYTPAAGAKNINFVMVDKSALVQFAKHASQKIIAPEQNPDSDGWIFGYRLLAICQGMQIRSASGIYASISQS